MSDITQIVLDELAEGGPITTQAIADALELDVVEVSQALATLKAQGKVYTGRGGWYLSEQKERRVHTHEAAGEPATATPAPAPAPKRKAKKAAKKVAPKPVKKAKRARGKKRTPAPAAVYRSARQLADATPKATGEAGYNFGITERGELTFHELKNPAKSGQLSAIDTARLVVFIERVKPMLPRAA